jgi:hypothetical protein
MNSTASYVELRYFSPFDIHKIPERILEIVHEQATGMTLRKGQHDHDPHQLTLPELLLAICDEVELKNGIRKELIKRYST